MKKDMYPRSIDPLIQFVEGYELFYFGSEEQAGMFERCLFSLSVVNLEWV